MGAVHPLADETVSTEFPERSFLLVWPEGSRNARGRGASREEVLCHRKPVSLLFSTWSVRMRHGGDALCRYSKTQSKPSTAGSIWRGGTVEWTSFRIYAETNDTKLAPTTAADTTAELGCGMMPRVSCDPPGCGSRGCGSCAAGAMPFHGAQDREAAKLPGRFSTPHRPERLSLVQLLL